MNLEVRTNDEIFCFKKGIITFVSVPGGPLVSKEGGHLLSMQETGIL